MQILLLHPPGLKIYFEEHYNIQYKGNTIDVQHIKGAWLVSFSIIFLFELLMKITIFLRIRKVHKKKDSFSSKNILSFSVSWDEFVEPFHQLVQSLNKYFDLVWPFKIFI